MHVKALIVALAAALVVAAPAAAHSKKSIELELLGSYETRVFAEGAAEISAYERSTKRLFVVNGAVDGLDVLDLSTPASPTLVNTIGLAPGSPNSVDVHGKVVAVAVQAPEPTDPGSVSFFDPDGKLLSSVQVGALPDMLTFTPDGRTVLVANEGEPGTTVNPEGSVSVIDMRGGAARVTQADVRTAGFEAFNDAQLDPSIRIFGPGATVAQDLEPEYIAVSHDGRTALVTLQENNAFAELDVKHAKVTALRGLGFKNHALAGNQFDASDRDLAIRIVNWPVFGMYQPDGIASYRFRGRDYYVTANEGDSRGFEEVRVGSSSYQLDPTVFPDAATLKLQPNLGRLQVTSKLGDPDQDGLFEEIYAFGARSFSIWTEQGKLVFDSGDALEQITAGALPAFFNASNDNNIFDDRSDNKGPEPEGVALGEVQGRTYAFIGLERIGGVAVYDVSDPTHPELVEYVNNRNFDVDPATGTADGTVGDLGPEGVLFVPRGPSPINAPLLVVSNEVSGSVTTYAVRRTN